MTVPWDSKDGLEIYGDIVCPSQIRSHRAVSKLTNEGGQKRIRSTCRGFPAICYQAASLESISLCYVLSPYSTVVLLPNVYRSRFRSGFRERRATLGAVPSSVIVVALVFAVEIAVVARACWSAKAVTTNSCRTAISYVPIW